MVRMLRTRLIPVFVLMLLLTSTWPLANESVELSNESINKVPANLEGYDLYLDESGSSGGDGAITTIEPSGQHKESSVLSGVEFRSMDLISDLTIYGEGSASKIRFSVYLQFKGQDQSTADLTFTLNAVGGSTFTETKTLDDPCNPGFLNNDCSWTVNEVFFDVPEDGFTVDKGAQLRLQIDGSASCEGQGGIGQGNDCDVLIAYGDVEQTDGFSRLELKANALADSTVVVHAPGAIVSQDPEVTEWSPNHRPEFRTIQFTVDIRDAFGRDDIHSVSLILSNPSGTNSIWDKEFEDDDLQLDNNGLVGNYTWTYDAGMPAGQYPLQLEIIDVQGHNVVYNHQGIEFMEHGMYLTLPANQPDTVLIAPGQISSVEFMVEHTGSAGVDMDVQFELDANPDLDGDWSDPVWDQPGGYALSGGGSFAKPILNIEAPNDLTDAPEELVITARAYAENDQGVTEEVAVETISLSVEEVGVYSPPRMNVYKDVEHQLQIADSERPEVFDPQLSHYIDSDEVGEFFIEVYNAGFDTDKFRLKVEDIPEGWQYLFYDNDTGAELTTEGINAVTPDIGSHEILDVLLKIYPPTSRDDVDIGMVTIRCSSVGDSEMNSLVSFTVHRTFGILAEVISDSDGPDIGIVGPVYPGSKVSFDVRVTDSTDVGSGQNTWRVISPGSLQKNIDNDPAYGTWDYTMTDDNGSNVVAIRMSSGETSDVKVEIEMRESVVAGNHTVYLRIEEENTDNDPRYFDLPLIINVKEVVQAGNVLVERATELVPFIAGAEQQVEFRVENTNNVILDVIISISDLPSGWDASMSTSGNQGIGNVVLLEIPAFSTSEFTMNLRASDDLVGGEDAIVTLQVQPMNNEVNNNSLIQEYRVPFATDCEGITCVKNALFDFDNPQTIGLYVGVVLVIFLAVYRRGQTSARIKNNIYYEDMMIDEVSSSLEDIPEPVFDEEDLEDDLELLEELDDL